MKSVVRFTSRSFYPSPGLRSAMETFQKKHDRQWTDNVTLSRIRATNVAVKGNKYYIFIMCVCSTSYPAWNAHAPYCHLWPVLPYCIFPQCLINGTIFGKTLRNTKCVFWFSLQISSKTFLILKKKWVRHDQ